jgi:hypothetical protein
MQRTIDRYLLLEVHHHPGPYNGRLREMQRLEALGLVWHDGRGWVLTDKGVGEMDNPARDYMTTLEGRINELIGERDALQAVVVQQCEALADTVPAHKLEELQEDFERLRDAVRTMFLNVFDTREPSGMDCRARELDMLDLIAEMARYEG